MIHTQHHYFQLPSYQSINLLNNLYSLKENLHGLFDKSDVHIVKGFNNKRICD